jgi:hypothetical protein
MIPDPLAGPWLDRTLSRHPPPLRPEHRGTWIRHLLASVGYEDLGRRDKGTVRRFVQATTGYSRAQVTRSIRAYHRTRGQSVTDGEVCALCRELLELDRLLGAEGHPAPDGERLEALRVCRDILLAQQDAGWARLLSMLRERPEGSGAGES